MDNKAHVIDLGVILCKHCLTVIDTIDSEKVLIYYSDCQEETCMELREQNNMNLDC